MRNHAWRRYKEEIKLIKRLDHIIQIYKYHHDENDVHYIDPSIKHFIGSSVYKMFKTYTTNNYDTRYKIKYSPNHTRSYWRDNSRKGLREKEKLVFLKILKEYGLR